MPINIPARNVAGDQVLESSTNANTREEQHVRLSGTALSATTTGTITTAATTVTATGLAQHTGVHVGIIGTYATFTANFEVTYDGTNWWPISGQQENNNMPSGSAAVLPANATRSWLLFIGGATGFRVRASAVLASGTATVILVGMPSAPDPAIASVSTLIPPGAVPCSVYVEGATATAADALVTLSKQLGTAAVTTGTSISPTVGSTLRITGGHVSVTRATATTVANARVRIRANTAGAAIVTSPIFWTDRLSEEGGTVGGVNQVAATRQIAFATPFIDIPSGGGLAVTHLNTTTSIFTTDVLLTGYEY